MWRVPHTHTHTLAEMRQQGSFLCLPNAWVHTQYGILDWHHPFTPYPRLMVSSFQAHTCITNAQKVFRCTKWKAAWSDAVTPGSSGVAYPKTKIAGWSSSICNHKIYTFKTEASAPPGATWCHSYSSGLLCSRSGLLPGIHGITNTAAASFNIFHFLLSLCGSESCLV